MMFQNLTAISILALVAGLVQVHAAPATTATDELVIISTEVIGNNTLTYWGAAPGTSTKARSPELIPRACGTNNVACSGDHQAPTSVCNTLIGQFSSNSGTVLGSSPRAVCLGQGNSQCCASWSADVGSFPQGFLHDAAQAVVNGCAGGVVSGLARNVDLNGGCVTQCLSNRANGCS